MSVANKLKKLGGSWSEAAGRERTSFEDLEPGVYLMALTGATLDEFGAGKKLAIMFKYTVQEGESEGAVQTDFENMETEDNLYWVQAKLEKLGYELPEAISELPEVLKDIEESRPILRCKVTLKDGFTHVNIQKVVEAEGGLTRAEILGEAEPEDKKAKKEKKAAKAEPEAEEKKTSKRKKKPAADAPAFEEGDKVSFEEEGDKFTGVIEKVNGDSADVAVDEIDESWDVELTDLTKVEAEKKKSTRKKKATKTFKDGAKVSFDGDDGTENGVITQKNEDGSWEVQVDDDLYDLEEADLTLL